MTATAVRSAAGAPAVRPSIQASELVKLPLLSRVTVARRQAHASQFGLKAAVCLAFAAGLAATAVAAHVLSGGLTRELERVLGFAEFGLMLFGLRYFWAWTMAGAYWRFETDPLRLAQVARLKKLHPKAAKFVAKVELQDRPLTVGETRDLFSRFGHLLDEPAQSVVRGHAVADAA